MLKTRAVIRIVARCLAHHLLYVRCVNRAAVFICHGAGEHCQAYSKLANKLTDCGMLVFGHDHGELIIWYGKCRFI